MSVREWHVVAVFGAAAAALLIVSTITFVDWFDEDRVGTAGEWFAGIGAAAVLAWAVGEPSRQRAHERETARRERQERSAERAAHAIASSYIRPDEPGWVWNEVSAQRLRDVLEVESQVINEEPLAARVGAAVVCLKYAATEYMRRGDALEDGVVKFKTAVIVDACNEQILHFWRGDPLPDWVWEGRPERPRLPPDQSSVLTWLQNDELSYGES